MLWCSRMLCRARSFLFTVSWLCISREKATQGLPSLAWSTHLQLITMAMTLNLTGIELYSPRCYWKYKLYPTSPDCLHASSKLFMSPLFAIFWFILKDSKLMSSWMLKLLIPYIFSFVALLYNISLNFNVKHAVKFHVTARHWFLEQLWEPSLGKCM